jgi:hypothetical protein
MPGSAISKKKSFRRIQTSNVWVDRSSLSFEKDALWVGRSGFLCRSSAHFVRWGASFVGGGRSFVTKRVLFGRATRFHRREVVFLVRERRSSSRSAPLLRSMDALDAFEESTSRSRDARRRSGKALSSPIARVFPRRQPLFPSIETTHPRVRRRFALAGKLPALRSPLFPRPRPDGTSPYPTHRHPHRWGLGVESLASATVASDSGSEPAKTTPEPSPAPTCRTRPRTPSTSPPRHSPVDARRQGDANQLTESAPPDAESDRRAHRGSFAIHPHRAAQSSAAAVTSESRARAMRGRLGRCRRPFSVQSRRLLRADTLRDPRRANPRGLAALHARGGMSAWQRADRRRTRRRRPRRAWKARYRERPRESGPTPATARPSSRRLARTRLRPGRRECPPHTRGQPVEARGRACARSRPRDRRGPRPPTGGARDEDRPKRRIRRDAMGLGAATHVADRARRPARCVGRTSQAPRIASGGGHRGEARPSKYAHIDRARPRCRTIFGQAARTLSGVT